MSENRDKMSSMDAGCARFQELIERQLVDDEAPAGEDQQFLDTHAGECGECGAFRLALDAMRETEPLPEQLVADVVDQHLSARSRRAPIALAVAAAVAAALAVVMFTAFDGPRAPETNHADAPAGLSLEVARGQISSATPAISGPMVNEGTTVETDRESVLLRADDSLALGLDTNTSLSAPTLRIDTIDLHLNRGRTAVWLKPGGQTSLAIHTTHGTVNVTGTIFGVTVNEEQTTVHVVEGSVLLSTAASAGTKMALSAGQSCSIGNPDIGRLAAREEHEIRDLLGIADTRLARAQAPAVDEPAAEPIAEVAAPAAAPTATRSAQESTSRRSAAETGSTGGEDTPEVEANEEAVPTPGELIRAAREARRNGDWAASAEAYRRVMEAYPDRPEAITVLVPLADIELDHLGRAKAALGHFDTYRARQPRGPLAEEALYGRCKALRALGRRGEEARSLAELLSAFPDSVHAENARARLKVVAK